MPPSRLRNPGAATDYLCDSPIYASNNHLMYCIVIYEFIGNDDGVEPITVIGLLLET